MRQIENCIHTEQKSQEQGRKWWQIIACAEL